LSFGGALGLAIVPCWIYVDVVTASRAGEAAALLQQQRLAKAEPVVMGLCELGCDRRVGAMTTFEARRWLTAELPALNRQAIQPLPASPTPKARMDRAVLLVKLEQLDESAAFLRPLVPEDDAATAMLAAIEREQGRFADSDALNEGLLVKRLPEARTNGAARVMCESAFAGLAESARAEHRFADAEAVLTRGLRNLPGDSAQLHFLLGRTYRDLGRFDPAVEHLQTAARLEPARYGEPAHDMIQQLRTSTLGCFTHARRRSLADRP
jgi:tetratricopeptide (TPR) repeat protein